MRNLKYLLVSLLLSLGIVILSGLTALPVLASDRTFLNVSLDFINEYQLPKQKFENTPVGGLSGLAYDRFENIFYAISDDRSEFSPARFYALRLQFAPKSANPQLENVEVIGLNILKDKKGNTYPQGEIDPEAIALTGDRTVLIASEGVASKGIDPFIDEFDLLTGKKLRSLPIPSRYLPKTEATEPNQIPNSKGRNNPEILPRGVRDNLGFEAMTVIRDSVGDPYRVFTITENALAQDAQTDTSQPSESRFLHYLVGNIAPLIVAEHRYPVEAMTSPINQIGVNEIIALDRGGHFLTLERSNGANGLSAKIWQIFTGSADDTSSITSFRASPNLRSIRKKLVLDLAILGIKLDNLEGMAIGPKLADGSQSLILVSDDNFSNDQVTQFLFFRLQSRIE
ncbi:esterase-like activity of phytase family protein [Pseudanabaena sp. FACHB-1998]|uniref:esterase-like activity of phytase family protein n=1 Tax=Pseudanabaena sp. FACHB-1998 TaxID=2692858 RepID=UPI001680CCDC|nr:esterase-like activity of phytase family protein [Pseudanabaena sp. FACHB-1998]MBD2178562.1 esterase-like activity of phytase family protein [Pseudanabaena sp. FACHB-1998]